MEVMGDFTLMLLLSLMAVSASYAWHSKRICPDQRLRVGGDCSRYREYCPIGTVCERLGRSHKCQIDLGNDCSRNEQCSAGAFCIDNKCIKIAHFDESCGVDVALCDGSLFCDQIGKCKIDMGDGCTEAGDCRTDASCVNNECECGSTLTRPEGFMTSPNYPNFYPSSQHCVWNIIAPDDFFIKLTFVEFHVEQWTAGPDPLNYHTCNADYVKLFNGTGADAPELLMICGQGNQEPIWFRGNVLQMVFHADCCDSYFRGFKIEYAFVPEEEVPVV